MLSDPNYRADAARAIVRESGRVYDELDPLLEYEPTMTSTRGRSARIDIPTTSLVAYRDALHDLIQEAHRQLADSHPAKMKGRHVGIVLGEYQRSWRGYVAVWKRRGRP